MSKNNSFKFIFIVVLIINNLYYASCCTDREWTCNSGQCIASDELCDGNPDCQDGSDETADVCIQQSCPSFAFRCTYGACLPSSAKCNGINECADNSDELSSLCSNNGLNSKNSKCGAERFDCLSGECISLDFACDGRSDCKDQSDETVDACASLNCPDFAFQCGYGACIELGKKCDGTTDCWDGSDETQKLCGDKHPIVPAKKPPTRPISTKPAKIPQILVPTQTSVNGCIAPDIPNLKLTYEYGPQEIISPGQPIPNLSSIKYKCRQGYFLEGSEYNFCNESKWHEKIHSKCIKFCPKHVIQGITFKAVCNLNGRTVPCDDKIKSGTRAKIHCQDKYKESEGNLRSILVCGDDGEWDNNPRSCEQVCGIELAPTKAFVANGIDTPIDKAPWHVAIYQNFDRQNYKHICGGTIISAKIVVSAAHCFWDFANQIPFNSSYYVVGAGKYYRDYEHYEPYAEFKNISEIKISSGFKGAEDFKKDIAVVILNYFLTFSPYIAAACIKWETDAAKSVRSDIIGRISGWGEDENGNFSRTLRTIEVPSSSYLDCKTTVGPQLSNAVPSDKFCVLNRSGSVVCQGDSGGGFIVKTPKDGEYVNYLVGIVSGGVPVGKKCPEYTFVSFTNIQYYDNLIEDALIGNHPK